MKKQLLIISLFSIFTANFIKSNDDISDSFDLDVEKVISTLNEKKVKELIESDSLTKEQRTELKERINEKIRKLAENLEKRFVKKDVIRGL